MSDRTNDMNRLSESVKFKIIRQYSNLSTPVGKPFNDLMPGDIFNCIALICSAIVAVLGVLIMTGWVTGMWGLASLGSISIPQAPASALAFILLGGTWFFYLHKPSRRLARRSVLASALFVLIVSLLNLTSFFTGVNVVIEELLISRMLALDPGIYGADPMSPITATSFLLSCAAMILQLTHVRRTSWLSGSFASIVTSVNLVVLLGYLYGTPLLYGGEIRPVSLPTGISFVFLSTGLIATAGPGHFPLRLLVGPSMRALLLRYFLLVILIFALANAVIYNLFSQLITNVALRTALAALIAIVVNSAVVLQLSRVIGGTIEREETERKLVENALLESEEKFRSIVEQSGDGIVLTDEKGIIIEWNRAEEQIIGMKRAEAVGRPIWDVQFQMSPLEKKTPEAYEKLRANMLELIMTGHSQWLNQLWENDIQCSDGTRRSVQVLIFLIKTGKGWKAGSISRDITERKHAEKELNQRAQLAVLGAEVGIALTQGDTLREILQRCTEAIVQYLDAALARIWTLNQAEDFLELQASAGIYTHINGSHSRVPIGSFKIGLIAKERRPHMTNSVIGDPRIHDQEWAQREGMVAFAGYPLIVQDRLVGVMAMFARQPLTDFAIKAMASVADSIALGIERKQTEEAIKRYARELEESNRMKELFIDIMHHDLINPLTAASGYIQLLQEEQMYLKNVYLEGTEKSLVRAQELIENATTFSKLRSLKSIDFKSMDLKEMIERVVENFALLASRAGMVIQNNITYSMPVSGNKMIEDVFANLISNAVKYAPKGKRIIIDSMDAGELWRIRVIDFGEGIRDTDKSRIFDRFLRAEKKGVKGSGLGLAIAERIVELHRGRIWVEDNPEGGAVFIVEVPKNIEDAKNKGFQFISS